jgi:DNA repair exonuclease SbcCD nuclease subunit
MKDHYRIVAIADTHIGGQRWGVHADDWSRPTSEALVYAGNHEADVVVVAGDTFHRRHPTTEDYRSALGRLPIGLAPLLIVDGNHDVGATRDSVPATWVFGNFKNRDWAGNDPVWIQSGGAKSGDVKGIGFIALPWPRLVDYDILPDAPGTLEMKLESARSYCLGQLKTLARELDPRKPRILVGHAMLSYYRDPAGTGFEQDEPHDPGLLLGKDIVLPVHLLPKVDAYLFGHVHQPDRWYIGSTQPTDFADTAPKSFVVLDLTRQDDGTWKAERTTVPYKTSLKVWDCKIELDDDVTLKGWLVEAYRRECDRRRLPDDVRFDVARIRVEAHGREVPEVGEVRERMEGFADRVVSVEVVRPIVEARRIAPDGPAIAALKPEAAMAKWLELRQVEAGLRDRTLAEFENVVGHSAT